MSSLKKLIACSLGPRLNAFFRINGRSLTEETPSALLGSNRYYKRNQLELISDNILRIIDIAYQAGFYISPTILSYCIYKHYLPISLNALTSSNNLFISRIVITIIAFLLTTFAIRGYGRFSNPDYLAFLKALNRAKTHPSDATKRILNHYDFDFKAWPVDYTWISSKSADLNKPPRPYERTSLSHGSNSRSNSSSEDETYMNKAMNKAMELISYAVMTTFGRRMIYPGSMSFFQTIMQPAILNGRAKLIEEYQGERFKLVTHDNKNYVDSMFVDRRNVTPNGNTLVVGCEGNGGFYELGVITAPLECGYSVLGWNHPGFGGSSGIPYPSQEVAAIDVVLKFAIDRLGFEPESIIVHGWSIGGFTATWAGMRYPNIGGLVIDASFDTILPLALNVMPPIIAPLTKTAITKYFDLNNSGHLEHYKGPILLIRRSQDEVIATDPRNSPATNRANQLLLDLLKQRFPLLIDDSSSALLQEYMAGGHVHQNGYLNRYSVNVKNCMRTLLDYFRTTTTCYPVEIGPNLDRSTKDQLVLFLASKHLHDYDSLHCAPLPSSYFERPWDLITLALRSSNL